MQAGAPFALSNLLIETQAAAIKESAPSKLGQFHAGG
jgi:hypothetical protein